VLKEGNYTAFNKDVPGCPFDEGKGNGNLYGTHPFILAKTKYNNFIGIYF